MNTLVRALATLGPIGFAPVAPATVASAVVVAIAWFVPILPLPAVAAMLVAGSAVAVWSSGVAERTLGHDAHPIVIDEVIGQSIALLFVPRTLVAYAIAFVLFRVFDIWKPLGAREAQRLPAGLGVVADDVIAGATACIVFRIGALVAARFGSHTV